VRLSPVLRDPLPFYLSPRLWRNNSLHMPYGEYIAVSLVVALLSALKLTLLALNVTLPPLAPLDATRIERDDV